MYLSVFSGHRHHLLTCLSDSVWMLKGFEALWFYQCGVWSCTPQCTPQCSPVVLSMWCGGRAHLNVHPNIHIYTSVHTSVHTSIYVSMYTSMHTSKNTSTFNAHFNVHLDIHVKAHPNSHLNVHLKAHINAHLKAHMVRTSDSWSRCPGFNSRPFHFYLTTLGKLFTHICPCTKQYNVVRAKERLVSICS